jgi:hypothetical protein
MTQGALMSQINPKLKTNGELRATLEMVLARLDSEPKSDEEWQTIAEALRDSRDYAVNRWHLHDRPVKK